MRNAARREGGSARLISQRGGGHMMGGTPKSVAALRPARSRLHADYSGDNLTCSFSRGCDGGAWVAGRRVSKRKKPRGGAVKGRCGGKYRRVWSS